MKLNPGDLVIFHRIAEGTSPYTSKGLIRYLGQILKISHCIQGDLYYAVASNEETLTVLLEEVELVYAV